MSRVSTVAGWAGFYCSFALVAVASPAAPLLLPYHTATSLPPGADSKRRLLKRLKNDVADKLATHQYETASWSTRNWMSYSCQKLSVKLHIAVAWEIGYELGLPACSGTDPRVGGEPNTGGA